jgi:hypothetical protein
MAEPRQSEKNTTNTGVAGVAAGGDIHRSIVITGSGNTVRVGNDGADAAASPPAKLWTVPYQRNPFFTGRDDAPRGRSTSALLRSERWRWDRSIRHASSLNNLALLNTNQGNYAAAEPLLQRALKILDGSLGPEHPTTIMVRQNSATLREKMDGK